ncbi:hypothetical protein BDV10DRAFT_146857 [Aspergillus recurvatus]
MLISELLQQDPRSDYTNTSQPCEDDSFVIRAYGHLRTNTASTRPALPSRTSRPFGAPILLGSDKEKAEGSFLYKLALSLFPSSFLLSFCNFLLPYPTDVPVARYSFMICLRAYYRSLPWFLYVCRVALGVWCLIRSCPFRSVVPSCSQGCLRHPVSCGHVGLYCVMDVDNPTRCPALGTRIAQLVAVFDLHL